MQYKIEKKTHFKSQNDKSVSVVSIAYCSSNCDELIEVISLGELGRGYLWRCSKDNGQTWKIFEPKGIPQVREQLDGTKVVSYWQAGLFYDDDRKSLIAGWLKGVMDESVPAYMDSEGLKSRRMYYQISEDGGLSWGALQELIEGEYDTKNWPNGFGCFGGYVDFNQTLKLEEGTFIVPSHKMKLFPETGTITDKEHGAWWVASTGLRCYRKNSHLDCEFGQWLTVDRSKSARGLDEPTIVNLTDGRLLMIMRGGKPFDVDFPGVKFYSVSEDGGMSWSAPEVLTYEDGSLMYSPSSMVQVFRWKAAENGIYLVTNILDNDEIIRGCDPRYPLQIARVNEEKLCVEKDSITIIENRKPEQAPNIRFSNFCILEDRQKGVLRLFMTACPGDVGKKPGDNVPLDSYEYVISFR